MQTIWYVAWLVVCLNGDCTRFESVPYYKNISPVACEAQLRYVFTSTVGPYYDERIDFENTSPEDIKIIAAGCDTTDRRPEDEDGRTWRIVPGGEPLHERYYPPDVDKNDLRWQQQQEHNIDERNME